MLQSSTASERFNSIAANYASSEVHQSSASITLMHRLIGHSEGLRVLDVACGAGHFGYSFSESAANLTFCDPASAMLDIVRRRAGDHLVPLSVKQATAEALPFDNGLFDVVISRLAPHHFTDPARAISEMARVTKSGGFCGVIDLEGPPQASFDKINHELEVLHDPTHRRSYTAAEWCRYFRAAGLSLECVQSGLHESQTGVTIARWCEIAGSGAQARAEIEAVLSALDNQRLAGLGIWRDEDEFRLPVRTVLIFAVKGR